MGEWIDRTVPDLPLYQLPGHLCSVDFPPNQLGNKILLRKRGHSGHWQSDQKDLVRPDLSGAVLTLSWYSAHGHQAGLAKPRKPIQGESLPPSSKARVLLLQCTKQEVGWGGKKTTNCYTHSAMPFCLKAASSSAALRHLNQFEAQHRYWFNFTIPILRGWEEAGTANQ